MHKLDELKLVKADLELHKRSIKMLRDSEEKLIKEINRLNEELENSKNEARLYKEENSKLYKYEHIVMQIRDLV